MAKRSRKKSKAPPSPASDSESEPQEEMNEEEEQDFGDDESIDEDEAFNSEDERKYGAFFEGGGDDSSDDGDDSSDGEENSDDEDEEEEEGDGGQYMLDLLNILDSPNDNGKRETSEAKQQAAAANNVSESQFVSSVVKKGSLTLDSLMEGLQDTKGFGVMQKSLKKIARGETTQTPVAKVVSKRAERKVHYEDQSKEVSLWLDSVQQNRKAETLDFRPKERLNVTRDNLIEKFVPTTNFEKAVHAALQEAGQEDEEAILNAEEAAFLANQDDLGANEQSLEEYKKRRGQLAKMRALMFYHEQKRHRINKIKSKKYRRIRKKQRERAKESEIEAEAIDNPDILRELEEKEELGRMKERMTLAHKNTSKWAKRILKRGKNVDADTRKALSAQLKRGDDLRKKMTHASNAGDSDESESEDLVNAAAKVLQETQNDEEDTGERKGLFKLKFMKKGIEKQRAKAKEEARQLLRELETNEELDDYDRAIINDSDSEEKKPTKKRSVASKEAMKEVMSDGEMVASSLKFGKSNAVSVSGGINIDFGAGATTKSGKGTRTVSEHTAEASMHDDEEDNPASPEHAGNKKKEKKEKKEQAKTNAEEENPWISASENNADSSASKKALKRNGAAALKTGMVDVERVLDVLDGGAQPSTRKSKRGSNVESSEPPKNPQSITMLSQEELVRRAFATSEEKDVEEDFAKEKADVEDEENDVKTAAQKKKEKDMETVSGWGSWAGAGAPPPKPPKKLPKHLQPPKKKETKRKRQDKQRPNVIVREKRIKKTADKFMLNTVPYPYTSREEYERAMAGAVGREWNVSQSVKDMTRQEIQTKAGKIIQPISMKAKKQQQRAPAKF